MILYIVKSKQINKRLTLSLNCNKLISTIKAIIVNPKEIPVKRMFFEGVINNCIFQLLIMKKIL